MLKVEHHNYIVKVEICYPAGADLGILGGGGGGVLGRNSSRGGGGGRVQVRGNFHILTSKQQQKTSVGGV